MKAVQRQEEKMKNELTEDQKREIKDAFYPFEETGITPEEMRCAMKTLGFDKKNEDVLKIYQKLEKQKNKNIDFDDFLDIMIEKNENDDPEFEIKKAFKLLCEEGTNQITLKSLKKICQDLGEKISEEELVEMINEADRDQDDKVGEEDFIKIMQKTGMF